MEIISLWWMVITCMILCSRFQRTRVMVRKALCRGCGVGTYVELLGTGDFMSKPIVHKCFLLQLEHFYSSFLSFNTWKSKYHILEKLGNAAIAIQGPEPGWDLFSSSSPLPSQLCALDTFTKPPGACVFICEMGITAPSPMWFLGSTHGLINHRLLAKYIVSLTHSKHCWNVSSSCECYSNLGVQDECKEPGPRGARIRCMDLFHLML